VSADDDGWDPDSFNNEKTRADPIEVLPTPEAVPEEATTGKYNTLTGFEQAAAKEISGARDRLLGRDEVFVGYFAWLMSVGAHADAAAARERSFRDWFGRNEELVQAIMRERAKG
jgi:hypothetical protein